MGIHNFWIPNSAARACDMMAVYLESLSNSKVTCHPVPPVHLAQKCLEVFRALPIANLE